ncbi:MAG: hypothetical protein B7Y39_05450 [Bdellovibrio sp. 28-41-41]|nr:MAG: hypothetical protein B7Y39_05450 [Bdellovibrio sp. 28-41-41]
MVIHDLSEDISSQSKPNPAPYLDRFFANVIDFLILAPVVSLFCGGINNDLRWAVFSKASNEVYPLVFQYVFVTFALFILYETMFIYFHGATPGHRFLYMRVTDHAGGRPQVLPTLFRSIFKFQAILAACIPFMEIIMRGDRSTFYDRLAQTQLISLRKTKHDQIHPEFKKIIVRWTHTSIIFFFLMAGLVFYKTVSSPKVDSLVKSKTKCAESLSFYVKNYLSKSRETENLNCARELVEKSFDGANSQAAINYLAQYVTTNNDDLKESYKNKYCAMQTDKLLCQTNVVLDYDKIKLDDEDVLNLLVDMNQSLAKNDHTRVFAILDILYTHLDWNKNLELYYMTSYLFLNEQGSRSPASEKNLKVGWDARKGRFLKRMSVKP